MADSALGSALFIPESALKKIKEVDDKLQKLQDTAKNTASSVTQSFKDMSVGTKPFLDSLDQVIAKLATINASASNASSGISNVGASAGNMNNNITSAAQNIQNMVAQLSKMNGSGTSGIMQAALAFQRLQESAKGASGMNIAELKQEIGSIESMLRDTTQNLTKADQDALIKRKKSLQDELRYQQQMYNERAVAFQKALDKMVSAEQSYNNKQRKAYADRAKDYQTRNNKANTTYQGALDFSATANTLNRQVRAIEYLKEARMKLSQTDADYKRKLDILNAAIEQHNKNLKEAGVNSRALTEQTSYMAGYMSRWAQRMAFAFSVGSIKNFVEQIASVRGQFELSERSLEAILQNKPKADEIFNKTVELAVKSPFRIKDLVDYTRQLSAYRIESDKLYDTTKRLADVSAGLGVDMGRLILAYGQVKAAAYLRGSEVRQFTEAGINMYGELQQYFKEVKGEAYTTAQIVDMISKRKITFEDVEAIFQRMTDKGGTFYNMQEIQAETLQGKISNLKDAFDVMLNDIGKANEGTFKGMISGATEMLDNWQNIAKIIKYVGELLLIIKVRSMLAGTETTKAFARLASINNVAGIGKIALGIKSAISQIGTAAVAAGKAIQGALPIMALMTALEIFTSLSDSVKEYNENLSKAMDSYAKSMDILKKSQDSYTLAIKIDGKNGKDKREDEIKHLISEMEKQGYSVTIPVNFGSAEDADKVYQKLTSDYKKFIDDMMEMDAIRAQNIKDSVGPGENIDEDLSDYENSYNKIIAYTSKWESALESVRQNYKYLTEDAQLAVDRVGREEDYKDKTEYLEAVYNALQKAKVGFITFVQMSDVQRQKIDGTMDAVRSSIEGANASMFSSLRRDKEEVIKETKGLFDVLAKYTSDPKEIMLRINRFAADHDYSETKKMLLTHLAEDKFNIRISADTNSVQKTIDYIDKTVQSFVDSKTYKISIDVSDLKDPLSQWKNYFENLEKNQKALKESDAWLRRIMSKGKDKKGLFSSDESMFTDDELKLIGVKRKPKMYGAWAKEQANEIKLSASQLEKIAKERLKAVGDVFTNWDWETKEDKKNARKNKNAADKAQRDILNERISLLKDMSSEYQKLIKYEGEEQATADVRKHFALAAKNVGMNINNFIPDRQTIAKKIEYLASQYKELGKRGSALRNATEIRLDIDEEYFKQQLDDAKNNAQEAFSQLDLFKKLKGEGLSDSIIKSMFGDLTSSFDDVRKSITDDFEAKWGKDQTKWGDDVAKEYTSQMQKLDKEVYQDQVNQAQELIKAYKQQLSDQLQLDKWYIEEKQKIQNNANISKNKDLQKQLQDNLDKQYASKTDTNSWKDFQNSDMYISIFENLDHTSNRVLTAMKARLEGLRSSLKNLTPEQLKQIVEQINKIDALLVERNPYSKIGKNFKEYLKFAKQRKKLEEEYIDATQKEQILKNDQSNANKDAENAEIAYNNAVRKYGVASKEAIQARILWDIDKERLRVITDQLVAQGKITEKQAEQIRNGQKLQKTLQQQVQTIGQNFSDAASSVTELFSALNDWGANIEMSDDLSEVVDGISKIGSSLEGIDITRPFSVVKGTIGVIGGIGKTLGGIFGWGTKDKKLQKQIENHQKAIEKLRERYSELKDAMDNAFDIERLAQYNDEMVKNLKTQNANLESMIKAEQDKKKTDNDKIEEYRKQIEANNKAIEEAEQSLTEQLGGFGTKANYKSAAEEFAKTWVDAYNEGSDALEALNDKFDEYIQNLIVKQATQRIVGKMVEPLLKKIDNAVEQGGEGGNNGLDLVKAELDDIMTTGKDKLKGVSDILKSFVDGLGYKPKGSSNISALQQGIQSVTESTAQALESILNSLRYYVATQQADVRIIRDTLLEKLGNSISAITQDTSSSPVLIELRLQTTILTDIRDTLASCVKGGHKQGRNGIKVFMN
nr:MAG TPA: tail tape measure [Caudoviricetes sp.]